MTAKLKAKVGDGPTAIVSELQARIAQLERENRRLRERCEEAELKSAALERSLKNAESTLSFRLGHAIIQSTKSLNGLRSLPVVLADLRRDSGLRKKKRAPPGMLGAVARSSAAFAGRLTRAKKKKR